MIDGTYYVIKRKSDGKPIGPSGVSSAPHLYNSKGKAEARRKCKRNEGSYETVPVLLTEVAEWSKS